MRAFCLCFLVSGALLCGCGSGSKGQGDVTSDWVPGDLRPGDADVGQLPVCIPDCTCPDGSYRTCGPDGCGGTCGICDPGIPCPGGGCDPDALPCRYEGHCEGKECGPDGAGGECGTCPDGEVCILPTGRCCQPDCNGKECWDDGCGGTCGTCPVETPTCVCTTSSCEETVCTDCPPECAPPDGECDPVLCDACMPACDGKTCGDNGCGGSCGECEGPQEQCIDGKCICISDCDGKECGDDGCGGSCGACEGAKALCVDGKCVEPPPPPKPSLNILSPPDGTYFKAGETTPITVELEVTGWEPWPAAGKAVQCYIDGKFVGTTEGNSYTFPDVPPGMRTLNCQLAEWGVALWYCEAVDSVSIKVTKSCAGPGDPSCDDGNDCSLEACVKIGDGMYECHFGNSTDPCCCTSKFDCKCYTGKWQYCDQTTSSCGGCIADADCDDGNPCTMDQCVKESCGTNCENTWVGCK